MPRVSVHPAIGTLDTADATAKTLGRYLDGPLPSGSPSARFRMASDGTLTATVHVAGKSGACTVTVWRDPSPLNGTTHEYRVGFDGDIPDRGARSVIHGILKGLQVQVEPNGYVRYRDVFGYWQRAIFAPGSAASLRMAGPGPNTVPGDGQAYSAPAPEIAPVQTYEIGNNGYRPEPEFAKKWRAIVAAAQSSGKHPLPLMLIGPSGCGKGDGARWAAEDAGLDFVKIDAVAIGDPMDWYGMRILRETDTGATVSDYVPSAFVENIGRPCVMLIDEFNRASEAMRGILLPLFDGSRQSINPLTGQPVTMHPGCHIILAGNVGMQFVGTLPVDPALLTRCALHRMTYLPAAEETALLVERTGIPEADARILVTFANIQRKAAAGMTDDEMSPIATRQLLSAAEMTVSGLELRLAVQACILEIYSREGGESSQYAKVELAWNSVTVAA